MTNTPISESNLSAGGPHTGSAANPPMVWKSSRVVAIRGYQVSPSFGAITPNVMALMANKRVNEDALLRTSGPPPRARYARRWT